MQFENGTTERMLQKHNKTKTRVALQKNVCVFPFERNEKKLAIRGYLCSIVFGIVGVAVW